MAFERITDADLQGKGVVGQPNNPGLSTVEMQKSVEQIPREVIVPAFNRLASQLEARSAAAGLGAAVPPDLPEETTATVQGVLEAVLGKGDGHAARADNPHGVTAAQTGAYTKEETDAAIDAKVVEIGAGDMEKAVYDPTGKKKDIFAAIETAQDETLEAVETAKEEALTAASSAKEDALAAATYTYTALLQLDAWSGSAEVGYTQTAAAESIDGGPAVTSALRLYAPLREPTGVKETDETLAEVLRIVSEGVTETGERTVTVKVWEQPTADLQVYWQGKEAASE